MITTFATHLQTGADGHFFSLVPDTLAYPPLPVCVSARVRPCVSVCLWGWLYLKRANSYCGATTGASAQPGRTAHKQINDHNPADLALERGKSRKPVRSVSRLRRRRFKEEEGACAFFLLSLFLSRRSFSYAEGKGARARQALTVAYV